MNKPTDKGEWVSVETPPEQGKRVLVVTNTGSMDVGYFYKGEWKRNWAGTSLKEAGYEITHWQYLPSPPNK